MNKECTSDLSDTLYRTTYHLKFNDIHQCERMLFSLHGVRVTMGSVKPWKVHWELGNRYRITNRYYKSPTGLFSILEEKYFSNKL